MVFPGVVITHKLKMVCQVKGEGSEDARSPLKSGTENFKKPNLCSRAAQSMTERRGGGPEDREPAGARWRLQVRTGPAKKPQKPLRSVRKFSQLPPRPQEPVYSQEPTARGGVTDPHLTKKWDPGQLIMGSS